MLKKVLAGLCAFAMILGTAAAMQDNVVKLGAVIETSADDERLYYGDYEYTVLDDGTVEISKYVVDAAKVTIPSEIDGKKVTRIGNGAFAGCSSLTEVIFPESLKIIGDYAFIFCCNIKNLVIPEGVESIGWFAFGNGGGFFGEFLLESVKFPSTLKTIGRGAFLDCIHLSNVVLPENLETIESGAFSDCRSITEIIIPKSVKDMAYCGLGTTYDEDDERIKGFKLYCYKDTAGEKYALDNNYDYKLLDGAETVPGDADGNGVCNMQDYALVQRYLANWKVDIDKNACDLSGDGEVNMQDYALFQRKLAGWDIG